MQGYTCRPCPSIASPAQQPHHAELTDKLIAQPAPLSLWHWCCSELPQDTTLQPWEAFSSL